MCDSVEILGILVEGVTLIYSVSHTALTYFLSNIMELDFYFLEKHCSSHVKSTEEVLKLRQSKVFEPPCNWCCRLSRAMGAPRDQMRDFPNARQTDACAEETIIIARFIYITNFHTD